MLDLKKEIMDICYNDGITRRKILEEYNKKYSKNVLEQSFNRSINTSNIKFDTLQKVLDSIGYTLEIKKKH